MNIEDQATHMARLRTLWALERTQLAWVRTAFTIVIAGLSLNKAAHALLKFKLLRHASWVDAMDWLAVVGAVSSAFLLAFATAVNLKQLKGLSPDQPLLGPMRWPVLFVSGLVILLGFAIAAMLVLWG